MLGIPTLKVCLFPRFWELGAETGRVGKLKMRRWGLKKISLKNIDFEILEIVLRKKILEIFEIFSKMKKITTNRKFSIENFKMFNEHFSICRENFSFSKKSQKFPGFFSQNQFSKFQNQYFSMRFFLNLIYAFAVSQRAHFKPCSATASSRKRPVPKICTRMSRILGIWGSSSLDRLLSEQCL